MAAPIFDQTGALQKPGDFGYPSPAGAEHLRKKLVGEIEFVAFDAIVRDQKPATATLFDSVEPVTSGQLRDLGEERLNVKMKRV